MSVLGQAPRHPATSRMLSPLPFEADSFLAGKRSNFDQCEKRAVRRYYRECSYDLALVGYLLVQKLPCADKERPVDDHLEHGQTPYDPVAHEQRSLVVREH